MSSTPKTDVASIGAFILSALWRGFRFALGGALNMAGIGIVAGAVVGPIFLALSFAAYPSGRGPSFLTSYFLTTVIIGAIYLAVVGALSGFLAFGVAGAFTTFARLPETIFPLLRRRAGKSAIVGTAIGGVTGAINAMLLSAFAPRFVLQSSSLLDEATRAPGGFQIGVTLGFAIGTFFGAVRGALNERKLLRAAPTAMKSTPE